MEDTAEPQIVAPRCTDHLPKLNIGFAWAHQGRELVIVNLVKGVPTGLAPSKTVQATPACLIPAGTTEPLKIATSGWTKRPGAATLDNERWTALVRAFSKAVGFNLHWSIRDTPKATERVPENDGRYLACHAEKKLGLFFLNLQIRDNRLSFEDALQGKLREASLPLHHRRAQIHLGHKPCKNCLDFLRLIRRRTGIDVRTSTSRVFSEHKRKRTFYAGVRRSIEPVAATENTLTPILDSMAALGQDSEDDEEDRLEKEAPQQHQYDSEDDDRENGDDHIIESIEVDDNLEQLDNIIETLPVGNVTRPRQKKTRATEQDRDKLAMPPPALGLKKPSRAQSVYSSPSPSVSMASVADSTIADRRMRYPSYSSPSRREISVDPPSVWGGRSKPPVTACLEAPDEMWGATGNDMTGISTASPSQPPYGQSYFFGTPSVASTQNVRDGQEETEEGYVMVEKPSDSATTANHARVPPGSHIPDSMWQVRRAMQADQGQDKHTARQSGRRPPRTYPSTSIDKTLHQHSTLDQQNRQQMRPQIQRENAKPPVAPVLPPYLQRLREAADAYSSSNTSSGRTMMAEAAARKTYMTAENRNTIPREPTPIDLTDDLAGHDIDDDVVFLEESPCPNPRPGTHNSTSSPANNTSLWHPPMRPPAAQLRMSRFRDIEEIPSPEGQTQPDRPQKSKPRARISHNKRVQKEQQDMHARRRGVAVPVRRDRGSDRVHGPASASSRPSNFPDLSSYRYSQGNTDELGWVRIQYMPL